MAGVARLSEVEIGRSRQGEPSFVGAPSLDIGMSSYGFAPAFCDGGSGAKWGSGVVCGGMRALEFKDHFSAGESKVREGGGFSQHAANGGSTERGAPVSSPLFPI